MTGGLPCADSGGGSVAIRDSTAAAQILRMDHALMSPVGMNHDFFEFGSILGAFMGRNP
jgi:hypothetical protein